MKKYIALLRGVNVGGKNRMPMEKLKALFIREGFIGVSTYIQSGNVIFSCEETPPETLQKSIAAAMEAEFGFAVPVCVLTAGELAQAIDHAPAWWNADQNAKHNAIFVIAPATVESIFAQVGQMKPEYEQAAYFGRVVFWSAPLATFSRTRFSRVVGTKAYDHITIRNANTALKLRELCQ